MRRVFQILREVHRGGIQNTIQKKKHSQDSVLLKGCKNGIAGQWCSQGNDPQWIGTGTELIHIPRCGRLLPGLFGTPSTLTEVTDRIIFYEGLNNLTGSSRQMHAVDGSTTEPPCSDACAKLSNQMRRSPPWAGDAESCPLSHVPRQRTKCDVIFLQYMLLAKELQRHTKKLLVTIGETIPKKASLYMFQ